MTTIFATGPWPKLQRHWDIRAAGNFIGGGTGSGLIVGAAIATPEQIFVPALLSGLVFVGLGLTMILLEIGRPWRALNVFFHPQTSWMTREGVVALPLFAFGGSALLLHWWGGPTILVTIFGLAAGVAACCFLYCQARILRAAKGIPAWREPALTSFILSTGLAEGMGILSTFAVFGFAPSWAVAAALGLAALRMAAWHVYRVNLKKRGAPAASLAALQSIGPLFLTIGNGLPALLLVLAILRPELSGAAALGGLILTFAGWLAKLTIVTKAAATRGLSIPHTPVRGRGTSRAARSGWEA